MPRIELRGRSTLIGSVVFVIAFLLNSIWEVAQTPWYSGSRSASLLLTFVRCLPATFLDAVFITVLYFAGWFIRRDRAWIMRLTAREHLALFFVGILAGAAVELGALHYGWWRYEASMPRMPLLGTGVPPTLQLALLSIGTFVLTRRLLERWRLTVTGFSRKTS